MTSASIFYICSKSSFWASRLQLKLLQKSSRKGVLLPKSPLWVCFSSSPLQGCTAMVPVPRIAFLCLHLGEPLAGPVSSACIAALLGTVQALKPQCWSFSLCRSIYFRNFSSFSMQDIFLCFPDLSSCKACNLHMFSISIH